MTNEYWSSNEEKLVVKEEIMNNLEGATFTGEQVQCLHRYWTQSEPKGPSLTITSTGETRRKCLQ